MSTHEIVDLVLRALFNVLMLIIVLSFRYSILKLVEALKLRMDIVERDVYMLKGKSVLPQATRAEVMADIETAMQPLFVKLANTDRKIDEIASSLLHDMELHRNARNTASPRSSDGDSAEKSARSAGPIERR